MKNNEPIKSQKEADQVFASIVNQTVEAFGISHEQAEKRVRALFDSGILEYGDAENPATQMMIDAFMATPID